MREKLLLDVPHRQVVFTIPKMLRVFFKYNRSLLSGLCLCGKEALLKYFKAVAGRELTPGIIAVIQSFGSRINLHSHLYANAHRGKINKAGVLLSHPPIIEEEERFVPSKGWAEMIRKVFEVDPLLCPACGGQMSIISFIEDHKVIDKIIDHLKLTFMAERPPPTQRVQQELLMAAEEREEYF